MDRNMYSPRQNELLNTLPAFEEVLILPSNILAAYKASEAAKLEIEAGELETKLDIIRERLATGNVLPQPEYVPAPEHQESSRKYEAGIKESVFGTLEASGIEESQTATVSYEIYHDYEFSASTEYVTDSITKHQGAYFVCHNTNQIGHGRNNVPQTQYRIIAHPDLSRPLVARESNSFSLDEFKESHWHLEKHTVESVVLALAKNTMLETALQLLGDPTDADIKVTEGRFDTRYTREITTERGLQATITGSYAHGEKRNDPDVLSQIRFEILAGGVTLKQYVLSARRLELGCYEAGRIDSFRSDVRELQIVQQANAMMRSFMGKE